MIVLEIYFRVFGLAIKGESMDYSRHLILYSGGADSTYFIQREETAKHLIHFTGDNTEKTQIAKSNATSMNKWLHIEPFGGSGGSDGEVNQIHALADSVMVLNASVIAARFGMKGVVIGFNSDDLGIDIESLTKIMRRAVPDFEILTPLANKKAADIRRELKASKTPYVTCMVSRECGVCPKCIRGY
jgi:7-cyano-7-deazaguanine synthase in queuosine biosynthesis